MWWLHTSIALFVHSYLAVIRSSSITHPVADVGGFASFFRLSNSDKDCRLPSDLSRQQFLTLAVKGAIHHA